MLKDRARKQPLPIVLLFFVIIKAVIVFAQEPIHFELSAESGFITTNHHLSSNVTRFILRSSGAKNIPAGLIRITSSIIPERLELMNTLYNLKFNLNSTLVLSRLSWPLSFDFRTRQYLYKEGKQRRTFRQYYGAVSAVKGISGHDILDITSGLDWKNYIYGRTDFIKSGILNLQWVHAFNARKKLYAGLEGQIYSIGPGGFNKINGRKYGPTLGYRYAGNVIFNFSYSYFSQRMDFKEPLVDYFSEHQANFVFGKYFTQKVSLFAYFNRIWRNGLSAYQTGTFLLLLQQSENNYHLKLAIDLNENLNIYFKAGSEQDYYVDRSDGTSFLQLLSGLNVRF